jgi:hypothetical protein
MIHDEIKVDNLNQFGVTSVLTLVNLYSFQHTRI